MWQKSGVIAPNVQHFYSEAQKFRVFVARVTESNSFYILRHPDAGFLCRDIYPVLSYMYRFNSFFVHTFAGELHAIISAVLSIKIGK